MTDLEWNKYVENTARTMGEPILYSTDMRKDYKYRLIGLPKYQHECKLLDEWVERYKEKENESRKLG